MAVIFNLGIDCGRSADVADAAVRHFDGLVIALPGLPPVQCRVHREGHRERWYVEVWPEGMGMATFPNRPELLSADSETEIRRAIHDRLRTFSGFRRAMFGGEAFDLLAGGTTPEEDADVDYTDMIYLCGEFSDPPDRPIQQFSAGYLLVGKRQMTERPNKAPEPTP